MSNLNKDPELLKHSIVGVTKSPQRQSYNAKISVYGRQFYLWSGRLDFAVVAHDAAYLALWRYLKRYAALRGWAQNQYKLDSQITIARQLPLNYKFFGLDGRKDDDVLAHYWCLTRVSQGGWPETTDDYTNYPFLKNMPGYFFGAENRDSVFLQMVGERISKIRDYADDFEKRATDPDKRVKTAKEYKAALHEDIAAQKKRIDALTQQLSDATDTIETVQRHVTDLQSKVIRDISTLEEKVAALEHNKADSRRQRKYIHEVTS